MNPNTAVKHQKQLINCQGKLMTSEETSCTITFRNNVYRAQYIDCAQYNLRMRKTIEFMCGFAKGFSSNKSRKDRTILRHGMCIAKTMDATWVTNRPQVEQKHNPEKVYIDYRKP